MGTYPKLERAPNIEESRKLLIQATREAWHNIRDDILVKLSDIMPYKV